MTQAHNPDDRERELRALNRRVDRLEYTQMSPQEFRPAFDRVYEEIDGLKDEVREMRSELNGKIDIITRHIIGQGNT